MRERILIYLVENNKKFIADFDTNDKFLELKDLVTDLNDNQVINNGTVKNPEEVLERWQIKSAKVKNLRKNRNQIKATIEVDCKLILRKTE